MAVPKWPGLRTTRLPPASGPLVGSTSRFIRLASATGAMRIFIVALTITSLTLPAYAQMGGGGMGGGKGGGKGAAKTTSDPDAAKKKAAEDKAFNDALKNIPAPNKPFDPWAGVRDSPKK